jgi:multidrug transporter EmrE-like cation transporter
MAFCVDYFFLQAYARGLPLSIGVPIIVCVSMGFSGIVGLWLGEHFNAAKLIGLALIGSGAVVLAAVE